MPETPPNRFCFAVIADSHFHLDDHDPQAHYASDGRHNDQNRAVVAALNRAEPRFVMHLGDVPHPVPGTEAHEGALDIAQETYAPLNAPLIVVPGNHDVGDKPQGWATAPRASRERHAPFVRRWGAPFGSTDYGEVHILWIDTPILNTGSEMEAEQRAWLLDDLATARTDGKRIFAFVHYPPFLHRADEDEHYDNLAEPARSWLLDTLVSHGVEALFCGHVHHFFWNRHRGMDIYILPATSFVRPGYSELCSVEPEKENGRDDTGKLGFLFVHVDETGHHIETVRTEDLNRDPTHRSPALRRGRHPNPPSPIGLSLRQDWMRARSIPAGNLDEFRRKLARFDLPLQALWEAGCHRLRLPAGDLRSEETRARILELHEKGTHFTFYSAGMAALGHAEAIRSHAEWIDAWEIVTLDGRLPEEAVVGAARAAGVPIFVSCIQTVEKKTGQYFSHFPRHGFPARGPDFESILAQPDVDGLIGVLPHDAHPWEAGEFAILQQRIQVPIRVNLELRRATEGTRYTDDLATARQVAEAVLVAHQHPNITLFLEPLVDHDRGYFPRNGLLDRRGRPRAAHRVWTHLERLLKPGPISLASTNPRTFDTPVGTVLLDGREWTPSKTPDIEAVDLETGQLLRSTPERPVPVILLRSQS